MGMTAASPLTALAVIATLLVGATACSEGSDGESGADNNGPATGGESHGSTKQGPGSNGELGKLQGDAESALEQIELGDGLRVENKTGGPVALVFPSGATAWVAAGKAVVVLKPCRERLPLRAERKTGELVAEHDGPCRRRDTWILGDD